MISSSRRALPLGQRGDADGTLSTATRRSVHGVLAAILVFFAWMGTSQAASCPLDAKRPETLRMSGRIVFKIFPGSPNFEDVRKGDQPEPGYFLELDEPTCIANLEEEGANIVTTSTIQLFPGKTSDFKRFAGQHVNVVARVIYEGMTARYHAPLAADVENIELDREGVPGEGPAGQTVVAAFYAALHEGNGKEAARFILPSRRRGGLSALAMTRFYGALDEPLMVGSIRPLGPSDFDVSYHFRVRGSLCNGHSVVSTVVKDGANYISSIRSLSRC